MFRAPTALSLVAAALATLAALSGCAPHVRDRALADAMMRDVALLSDARLAGRLAGSPGERAAADHVIASLVALGLEPHRQPLAADDPDATGAANVWTVIPGRRAEAIVLGAHLDHLGIRGGKLYPGADDNASGVAVVLAIARELVAHRRELDRSIVIVVFTAEESHLRGSRRFVAEPPLPAPFAAMVNLDMVGRPLLDQPLYRAPLYLVGIDRDRSTGLVGARHYPGLRALVDTAFGSDEVVAAEDLPVVIGREIERQSEGRSDSASFESAHIPALFFGDGESSDYHQPGDTLAHIRPALLERRARAIGRVVRALSVAPASAFVRRDQRPVGRKPTPGVYLPVGLELGAAATGTGVHPALGAAASLVYFRPVWFAGIAADALRIDGHTRFAIGPELGVGPLGIELDTIFAERSRGVAARVFASLGAISLAVRIGALDDSAWFGDLTLQLAFPARIH